MLFEIGLQVPERETLELMFAGQPPFAEWRKDVPDAAVDLAARFSFPFQFATLQLCARAPALVQFVGDATHYPLFVPHALHLIYAGGAHPARVLSDPAKRVIEHTSALPPALFAMVMAEHATLRLLRWLNEIWPHLDAEHCARLMREPLILDRVMTLRQHRPPRVPKL